MASTKGTSTQGTGVPSSILRLGGFVPTIMTGVRNLAHYKLLRDHVELQQAPYNQHTINAQYAPAVAGIFCFIWSLLTFIPTLYTRPNATFVVGCVDFGFAIVFVVASGLQGAYLPHTKGTCEQAESWQVPPGTPSFFQAISNFPGNKNSAEVICKEYYTTWCILVATAVLWVLSAVFSLLLGGSLAKWTAYEFRYLWIAPLLVLKSICFPLRPFFPRFRYIWRSTWKRLDKIRYYHEPSFRLRSLTKKIHSSDADIGLARLLSSGQPLEKPDLSRKTPKSQTGTSHEPHDVLALISRQLHHIDIVNLSLVSKRVHKTIFPSFVQEDRSELLRVYTCDVDSKFVCWACNTQICGSCKETKECTETKASLHLNKCRAFCSSCYYENVCKDAYKAGSCGCIIRTFNPSYKSSSYWNHDWNYRQGYAPNSDAMVSVSREICRSCSTLTKDELMARQDRRGADTIRQLASQPLACEKCKISLPLKGPRWWVCKDCRRECQCGIHPPWAPKAEEV